MTVLIKSIGAKIVALANAGKAPTITQNTSAVCIGRRLSMRRTSSGISEGEFCKKLGIGRDDLHAYERGVKRIGANVLLRAANLLDVGPDYFFQGYSAKELSACLESPV